MENHPSTGTPRRQQQQQQTAAAATTAAAITTSANQKKKKKQKKDFEEEWYFLKQLHMQWLENIPHEHVLFKKATDMVAPQQTLQYYQGVYHTLCQLHPVIALILAPDGPFKDDPQKAITEILQLQIGHTIGLMLDRWPQHLIPKITDPGNPRAQRSTMGDDTIAPPPTGSIPAATTVKK